MIFAGFKVKRAEWLGQDGEIVYFVAKDFEEILRMIANRNMFRGAILGDCRILTKRQITSIGLRWLKNGITWIKNDKKKIFKMDIACYFLGSKESDPAAG